MDFPYPQRPGEPDCGYYMKTGLCAFGMDCRYNHPPDRNLASGMDRSREDYPERIGQTDCQYYLKTGTCKFGSSCKYHHPRDRAGSSGRRQFNSINLPLRSGERDCAFYIRTGTCKFGTSCKFNHPQPVGAATGLISMPGSSTFRGGETRSPISSTQVYPVGYNPSWQVAAAGPPLIPSPPTPGQASFSPMVLPALQSFVQFPPGWNMYQGPGAFGPLDAHQHAALQQPNYLYGAPPSLPPAQGPLAFAQAATAYSPYMTGNPAAAMAFPMPSTSGSKESTFPERPGQPECQYYLKTGECRFGSTCRYHHPKERNPDLGFVLGPTGLPLRPGAPPCTFYSRHGFCKFGSTCKFDHPFHGSPYGHSVSSFGEMPVPLSFTMPSEVLQGSASQGEQFQLRRRGGQPVGNIPFATIDGVSEQDISTQSSDVGSRTLLGRSTTHPS